jgi:membrane protein required for colicin V production
MRISTLNWADYTIVGIVLISVLVSLMRGFVREALSLVTWIAAFWIAFTFYGTLDAMLTKDVHSQTVRTAIAFGSLFLITLILGALVNYLIGQLVDRTGLSGTDRVLGMLFGFARGMLLVAILLLLARLTPMPSELWWKQSVLVPQFYPIETWLHDFLPQSVADKFVPSY